MMFNLSFGHLVVFGNISFVLPDSISFADMRLSSLGEGCVSENNGVSNKCVSWPCAGEHVSHRFDCTPLKSAPRQSIYHAVFH